MCLNSGVAGWPDGVLGQGTHLGYEWVVVHNHMAIRCGYVRIPMGHPWYGQTKIPNKTIEITYANKEQECPGLCQKEGWWIGFFYDVVDPKLIVFSEDAYDLENMYNAMMRLPHYAKRKPLTQEEFEGLCKQICEEANETIKI